MDDVSWPTSKIEGKPASVQPSPSFRVAIAPPLNISIAESAVFKAKNSIIRFHTIHAKISVSLPTVRLTDWFSVFGKPRPWNWVTSMIKSDRNAAEFILAATVGEFMNGIFQESPQSRLMTQTYFHRNLGQKFYLLHNVHMLFRLKSDRKLLLRNHPENYRYFGGDSKMNRIQ